MKLQEIGRYVLKLFVSGVISFLLLSIICFFYYNVPVHFTNEDGWTDYVWETNKRYSRATEGFAMGKTNNEGLSNSVDYKNQNIDILMLGSSQFEGFNVMPGENMTAQLNQKFCGDYFAYNLGISGHDFLRCTQNLDKALEKYQPSQYVILEVSDLFLTNEAITDALNCNIPELKSSENKLVLAFEKIPLFRHFYNQLDNAVHQGNNDDSDEEKFINEDISSSLAVLIKSIAQKAEKYNTYAVFLYHSSSVDTDESAETIKSLWIRLCNENEITFLDMTEEFSSAFDNNEYVYGFLNTLPNQGHLNKKGHELIADRIYNFIITGE